MATSYEDLHCNIFYKSVRKNFPAIYRNIVDNGWILCVPPSGTLLDKTIDEDFVKQHVLQKDSMTLSGQQFHLEKNVLKIDGSLIKILSDETVYSDADKVHIVHIALPLMEADNSPLTSESLGFSKLSRIYSKKVKSVKKIIWDYYVTDREFKRSSDLRDCVSRVARAIEDLDVAVQNHVIYHIYKQLMDLITILHIKEDVFLNRVTRSVSTFPDKNVFGVSAEMLSRLFQVRQDFNHLAERKTVRGKLGCLRKVTEIVNVRDASLLTADELIPIFANLVAKSHVSNWNAQLYYLKNFNFTNEKYDEDSYYMTTLEAAIHWLATEQVTSGQPVGLCETKDLYYCARTGDSEQISEYLHRNFQEFCHPLCVCDDCKQQSSRPNINTLDENGYSALHYACMYGHGDATQALLYLACIDVRDLKLRTPLHLAAAQGHQTCVLLLCHQHCDLNAEDSDLNTALHLASQNGHESCVKALLYYAEHARVHLEVNAMNRQRETPLHLAARGGFWNVARVLLQWKADINLKNQAGQTASQAAQNLILARKILSFEQVEKDLETHKTSSTRFWNSLQRQLSFVKALQKSKT